MFFFSFWILIYFIMLVVTNGLRVNKLWIATWEIPQSDTKGLCNKVINISLAFKPLVCLLDPLPWDIFRVFLHQMFSVSANSSAGYFKLLFFGCFQRYTYLCINSRRSPDINECTLWILCALSRSGFCVFRLLARNLSTSLTSSEILTIFFLALLSSSSFDSFRNFCLDWAWVNWDL